MKNQLLLLEDIQNLGRKGDLVTVTNAGFARNFLLPQKKALVADKRTIRMQERLKEERAKQAATDKKDAEALAEKLRNSAFKLKVKSDPSGNLYGSVAAIDIVHLIEEKEGVVLRKQAVVIAKPIKKTGPYKIALKLSEGVTVTIELEVEGEFVKIESAPAPAPEETVSKEEGPEEKIAEAQEEVQDRTKE